MIQVEIANEQSAHAFDPALLHKAARIVLEGESIDAAEISIAIVDDETIHALNRTYLEHDYATDVLSFLLSAPGDPLEGEIVVSAETAAREALDYGWSPADELLLYLIHGTLHLVGYGDGTDAERATMRAQERRYLVELGRQPIDGQRASKTRDSCRERRPAQGETRS